MPVKPAQEAPHGRHITRWSIQHVHDDEEPRALLTVESHDPIEGGVREDIFRMPLQLLAATTEDFAATVSELLGNCEHLE